VEIKREWSRLKPLRAGVSQGFEQLLAPLRFLMRCLSDGHLSQVITSNYFSVLYHGSEVWSDCLSDKNFLSLVHHFP